MAVSLLETAEESVIEALFTPFQFDNWRAAHRCLLRMIRKPPLRHHFSEFQPALFTALMTAAHPDRALINFEHFLNNYPDSASLLDFLIREPRILEMLVTLFAGSQFLSEILLRHPNYFEKLQQREWLSRLYSPEQYYAKIRRSGEGLADEAAQLDALRRSHRRELLRIGTADLLGILDFRSVTRQLSYLADSIIKRCLEIIHPSSGERLPGFVVFSLGKLGGVELNYSSDIDLLFVARNSGREVQRIGQHLIRALSEPGNEGFMYRVDMRLRPWGNAGQLVPTPEEYLTYLDRNAQPWERQALLKARFVAGDPELGLSFIREVRPYIFRPESTDYRREVHRMKQKIEDKLTRRGNSFGEVKSGIGSIRDIEFTTQYLQLMYGERHPHICSRNTLDALARLTTENILPARHYQILAEGYTFLRSVEHYLQIMHNRQTHQLPEDARELNFLARRLGFDGVAPGEQLKRRYLQHRQAIREIYRRYLDSGYANQLRRARAETATRATQKSPEPQLDANYSELFSPAEVKRHQSMADRLSAENMVEVDISELADGNWQVTIVAYDYLGALSLICGLLFVHGFNILTGHIFTYHATPTAAKPAGRRFRQTFHSLQRLRRNPPAKTPPRKLIDVFTVQAAERPSPGVWENYRTQLQQLFWRLKEKRRDQAHGELAKMVASTLARMPVKERVLLPVDIEIDNNASENYTVLRIDAPDTPGFLYEFTNALALNGVYIVRVEVGSIGDRAHDTLFVTDARGEKITDPEKQRQLRLATVLVKHFTHLLPHSPNPASAMRKFRELVGQLFSRPEGYTELASLERPDVLDALVKLLGVSDFLWEDFLRMQHANLFPIIQNLETLRVTKTRAEHARALDMALPEAATAEEERDILNAYKDREMFRIDMRYIQGVTGDFRLFTRELSDLAEVVLETAFCLCWERLVKQYGEPRNKKGRICAYSVCGLGKFGGRELGFASDIELMFIFQDEGKTRGPKIITNAEFFEKMAQELDRLIISRKEGIFELDYRLRPYGKAGRLAVLLSAFETYFAPDGPAWHYERQALVRLRPIFGDHKLGEKIIAIRDRVVYQGQAFDVEAMRAIRERQIRQLVAGGTLNAKFSPGALVDLEYLVQGLQIIHGKTSPALRSTSTWDALAALAHAGILQPEEHQKLREAYLFLRRLIEALRMVRGNARDLTVPPEDSEEFRFLARRLDYGENGARLQEDLVRHTTYVQSATEKLLPPESV